MRHFLIPMIAIMILSLASASHAQDQSARGFIGVQLGDLDDETAKKLGLDSTDGVLIVGVIDNFPAKAVGIDPHDVIRKLDGQTVDDRDDLGVFMRDTKPGQVIKLTVIRQRRAMEFTLTLVARPTPPPPKPREPPN